MPELIPLKEFFYKRFELTPKQVKVLLFILQFRHDHGWSPTYREIGKKFGIVTTNGVLAHLNALMKKGAIRRHVAEKDAHGRRSAYRSRSVVPTFRFIHVNPVDSECAIS
jgi:SOS-response transcriptional repressor LexA